MSWRRSHVCLCFICPILGGSLQSLPFSATADRMAAASLGRDSERRHAVRDGAAALASRTFRVNSFLARPLRIAPAGTFERLALMNQIYSWSTRPTADDSRTHQVRSPSLEPAPPALPAHHTHRAHRYHPLQSPARLALVLRTESASRRGPAALRAGWRPCAARKPPVASACAS